MKNFFTNLSRRRKRNLKVGCGISLGVFIILIVVASMIKITPFEIYEDPKYRLRIKYPAHWVKVDRPEGGGVVAFVAPLENEMDIFAENVNITFSDFTEKPLTLDEYSRTASEQIKGTFGSYMRVLQYRRTKLAGLPAQEFSYVGVSEDEDANVIRYYHQWVMKGNAVYVITYTARKNEFKLYFGNVKAMLRSLELF